MLFILCIATAGHAGVLRIGDPLVEEGRFTFPVMLSGGEDQVTALDFRFDYDPAVFRPIAASGGAMAIQAGKVVNANITDPGAYRVVMMGLNRTAVGEGEVARVTLQRLGTDTAETSQLGIGDPTLATGGGGQLDARGDARNIDFRNPNAPRDDTNAGSIPDEGLNGGESTAPDVGENVTENSEPEPATDEIVTTPGSGMLDRAALENTNSGFNGDVVPEIPNKEALNSINSNTVPSQNMPSFQNAEQKSGIAESGTAELELSLSGDMVARLGGNPNSSRETQERADSVSDPRVNVAAVMVDTLPTTNKVESNQSSLLTRTQAPTDTPSALSILVIGGIVVIMGGAVVLWLLRKRLFD